MPKVSQERLDRYRQLDTDAFAFKNNLVQQFFARAAEQGHRPQHDRVCGEAQARFGAAQLLGGSNEGVRRRHPHDTAWPPRG